VQHLQAGEAALINIRRLHGFRNAGDMPLR
jgi:hypothetical protein